MNKSKISLAILLLAAVASFAQADKRDQPVTTVTNYTPPAEIPIESDEWFQSGAWRSDHDLQQLYFNIQESVRNSMPVDPSVLEASGVLQAKRVAALIAKAQELGLNVDENGNLQSCTGNDKNVWMAATKPINDEYSLANSQLYANWNKEFAMRFEEAFVEAARNLKLNADKMK